MANGIFCVIGAMVGAGFASGREIMAFFSQYGVFSWPLIILCVLFMTGMMDAMMQRADSVRAFVPEGTAAPFGRAVWLMLFAFTGGAMAAAAGEMWALTVPVRYARQIGAAGTLLFCMAQQKKAEKTGAVMGKLLLPALLCALLLCLRGDGMEMQTPAFTVGGAFRAMFAALGYGALNVTLSAGVICEAGRGMKKTQKRKTALLCGAAIGLLLLFANTALLRYGEARDAALPVVALLRPFGKEGFYLSAAVLYLAVVTTLTAQIKGLTALLPQKGGVCLSGIMTAAASLFGFHGIVGAAYPILGWAAAGMAVIAVLKKRPLPESKGRS